MSEAAIASAFSGPDRLRDRLATQLVLSRIGRWPAAAVTMALPDRRVLELGNRDSGRSIRLDVKDWRFFWRALSAGDIGVGESYMDGEWRTSDLVELCRLFISDQTALDYDAGWALPERLRNLWLRVRNANTLSGSRRNVQRHYDLSNEFFRLFLGDSMLYSCAVYPAAEASLEEAQIEKIDRICRRLELGPGQEVLEIGGGWGGFAMHAARYYGCRVRSLTISEAQHALATERIRAAGLDDRVRFEVCDYRAASGLFDRIVSIEMFEAVGYRYFDTFFRKCSELLRPGGRMLLQTITIGDQHFDRYRRSFDWIRKYIFPGGLLPSFAAITRAVAQSSPLRIQWADDIGPHYVRTLRDWRERFMARAADVKHLGFDDRFLRMWEFYLASCEAAFSVRWVGDVQIELYKP